MPRRDYVRRALPNRAPHTGTLVLALCFLALAAMAAGAQEEKDLPIDTIKLPPGFAIEVYSDEVPNARQMALGSNGTLFVGSRMAGKVHAVIDADGDQVGERVVLLAEDLLMPSGLAFHNGDLYVAEIHRIWRFEDIESKLDAPPKPHLVTDRLPKIRHHGWKFIAFGPDGWLYVPVGAPCNICESRDAIFDSILRMRPDGSEQEVYARGIRNTVGFDWHPESGRLWFTENGRDWMGNDIPPDELNVVRKKGEHFGYPYCHGAGIADPTFGRERSCAEFTPPAIELAPHTAAIGMRFYTADAFPQRYRNHIFIAEHGSWNRDEAIGYRITFVPIENGRPTAYETFAEGWLTEPRPWGRPADVLVMPDGALLVSDDLAGAVYRISYRGEAVASADLASTN